MPECCFYAMGNSVGIPYHTKSPTGLDHTATKRNYVARACLENAFCKMCVTVCGKFVPDEGVVVGYDNQIRDKSPAKWGVQIAGTIFHTRSSQLSACKPTPARISCCLSFSQIQRQFHNLASPQDKSRLHL